MRSTRTLYEVLGVAPGAGVAELQAAYRREFGALEAARGNMNPDSFNEQMQLLRLALSTLADPASRLGYDTKLAARRAVELPAESMALVPLARAAVTTPEPMPSRCAPMPFP